ncbi:RNA polymerase subunit sigma [Streptomyces sp. CB03234]|uniref:sigma-70 family RNA polymerase sigma factor n=1 Tax=Streptomyces sp. (strain CB03234) TaxID=1703937 RepID=UPI00093A73AF|nr:sigma-70 family RNA polymerase sigma factor [Streptomyces sp. CB03234]OKK08171.1 RNA polymerase subunit sigma [Streptomyces sp. CB03234]
MNDPFGKERDLVGPDPGQPGLDPRGEEFFRENLDTFMRIAAYRLRNLHDAEDALMEAMVTMHRRIERILAASNPIALATKILNDAITDYYRSSVRITKYEHLVAEMPAASALTELGRYDRLDRAMEQLEVIAPQQARCVQMYYLIGLSYAQTAEILGITQSAAKTAACRGRQQLTELMLTELPKEKGDS